MNATAKVTTSCSSNLHGTNACMHDGTASEDVTSEQEEILEELGLLSQLEQSESNTLKAYLQHGSESQNVFSLFGTSLPDSIPKHIRDCERLSEAETKRLYKREHDTWRSRRSYAKKMGIPFHLEWEKSFISFLRYIGPKPNSADTLDKIVPESGYVPGNIRWASKKTQAKNRDTTVFITARGETFSIADWATRTHQKDSTLYSRRERGWPDEAIVFGRIPIENANANDWRKPRSFSAIWPPGYAKVFEQHFQQNTKGNADRLRYLGHVVADKLKSIEDRVDSVTFPDWHSPSAEEQKRLESLNKEHQTLLGFWKHFQSQMERRSGRRLDISDRWLLRYR